MVVKVYVSRTSGNQKIKKQQELILQVLSSKKIVFQEVDISDPSMTKEKEFMRENATPQEGQKLPLPPQIFIDDKYTGDFDAFDNANECNELNQFLGISSPNEQANGDGDN